MEPSAYRIEAYQFGSITISGKTYTHDLIICPDGITAVVGITVLSDVLLARPPGAADR